MSQILPWNIVEIVISAVKRSLLFGPPGTGKTTAAHNAAKRLGRTAVNITLTDQTSAAELRGHWIPAKGNQFVWMNGPAIEAYLNGWVLILDEIDKASDDCFDFLRGLLNDNTVAQMTLPNGVTIKPDPDFTVIATMNGDLADLQDALRDRFREGAIEIVDPHPDAIASLPEDLQAVAAIPQSYNDHERPATLRSWKAYALLRELEGLDEEIAAKVVFGNRATELMDAIKLRDASALISKLQEKPAAIYNADTGYWECGHCGDDYSYEDDAIYCCEDEK